MVGVVVLLLVVALVASCIPAQRAARVDPMHVIRATWQEARTEPEQLAA